MSAKITLNDSAIDALFNAVPRSVAPTSPVANDIYLDDGTNTASGDPGWRRYTGAVWEDISSGAAGGTSLPIVDTTSLVEDTGDPTKEMRIDVGNVLTGTIRTLEMPDADVLLRKNNYAASVSPGVTDDSNSGYAVNSIWVDTTADLAYICVDSSVGAAVWVDITASGGGGVSPPFDDANSLVKDTADATKTMRIDVGLIPTATERILNMPNSTVNLRKNSQFTSSPAVSNDSSLFYDVGSRWINTTTDQEWVCVDASVGAAVWIETTQAGGSGGLTDLVGPTVLGGSAATIDLTGIVGTYEDLVLIVSARGDTAANWTDINVRFNGDTGTNYSYTLDVIGVGGGSTVTSNDAQSDLTVTNSLAAATATANYQSILKLEVMNYANTGKSRGGIFHAANMSSPTAMIGVEGLFGWANAADAITQITLTPTAGNFAAGTVYTLYGRG